MTKPALIACLAFLGWSALGRLSYDLWFELTSYWMLLAYVAIHCVLAGVFLRKAGISVLSVAMVIAGLLLGEWGIAQVVAVVSLWRVRGFAP
jgi:hypothetical protein